MFNITNDIKSLSWGTLSAKIFDSVQKALYINEIKGGNHV